MEIKIKLNGGIMPHKAHQDDAAFDVFVPEDIELKNGRQVVDLGFAIELPHGYAAIIQPRSGFSLKGIEVCYKTDGNNACNPHFRLDADVIIGLVDENYRGNVGAILCVKRWIEDNEHIILERGVRIAQLRIVEVPEATFVEVNDLSTSERGDGGYGHTGTK